MGKSKSRNRAKHRIDPTGKPAKPPTDPELAALRQKSILPVLKDLQSPELKTRSAAARAITNLIENTKTRKLLLREQIVKILLEQTLTDSSVETKADGWGILQNLVLEEDVDFCIHLYRQDILTAIESAGQSILEALNSKTRPFCNLPKPQQRPVWTVASSIISLISSLAEAQDEINQTITGNIAIPKFLVDLFGNPATPNHIQCETLNCLAVILEDNRLLATQLANREERFLDNLMMTKSNFSDLKGVAACGVLHNMFSSMRWYQHNTPKENYMDASLIPTLVRAMNQTKTPDNKSPNESESSNENQAIQLALEITMSIASSVQDAFLDENKHGHAKQSKEFEGLDDLRLTNEDAGRMEDIEDDDVGQDDEEDEMDAEAPEDDAGEMDEDEMDADMAMVTADPMEISEAPTEDSGLHLLVQTAAPAILKLATQNNEHVRHAIMALSNIAWMVSMVDFSGDYPENTYELWKPIAQSIWDEVISSFLTNGTADLVDATMIAGLAWAVSLSVGGRIKIKPGEHRALMALYKESRPLTEQELRAANFVLDLDDAFGGLAVRCIGVLGTLARSPAPIELNRDIGVFLLTVLSGPSDTPPAEIVEALNQLFDIYADRSYAFDEPVFWGNNFLQRLEEVQYKFKRMAKDIDKRYFPELRIRADEAVLNLDRFLSYKRKEKKKGQDDEVEF